MELALVIYILGVDPHDTAAWRRIKRNAVLASSRLSATSPFGPCVGAGACLFDHLVGAQQNRREYGKTERLGSLEAHDHLELARELHREVARLRAAQNAIDISGAATPGVASKRSITKAITFSIH